MVLLAACGDSSGSKSAGDGDSPGDGDGVGDGDQQGDGDGTSGDGDEPSGDGDEPSGDGDGDSQNFPPISGAYDLRVSTDPLRASLTYDEAKKVSQKVEFEGGTLTATASDGTVYTLTIPANAMPYPQRIRMTPIASLSGLPFEAAPFGVRLEPDGFEFVAPVKLQVTLPAGVSVSAEREIPLSITGDKNLVSLGLLEPDAAQPTFFIQHFSSYAVVLSQKGMNATLSESEVRSRFGGDELERIQTATAEKLARERQRQLLGQDDGEVQIDFDEIFKQMEERVLKGRLAKAGESCAASKLALQTLLGVERQRQLLGMESTQYIGQLDSLIGTGVKVCLKEEYEICRDEHIITRMLPVYYSALRQDALMDESPLGFPIWMSEAEEYLKKCLSFELVFDSSVQYSYPDEDLSMSETVSGRVPVQYVMSALAADFQLSPPANATLALIFGPFSPLTASSYSVYDASPCDMTSAAAAKDGQLAVSFMSFTPADDGPSVTDIGISLGIVPNLSTYNFVSRYEGQNGCEQQIRAGTETLSWSTSLGTELTSKYTQDENGAYITGWSVTGGDVFATKEIAMSYNDGTESIQGPVNMVLFHKPVK